MQFGNFPRFRSTALILQSSVNYRTNSEQVLVLVLELFSQLFAFTHFLPVTRVDRFHALQIADLEAVLIVGA